MSKQNTKFIKVDELNNYECYKNENYDKIEFDEYVDKDGKVSDKYIRVTIYNDNYKVFDGIIDCELKELFLDVFNDVNDCNVHAMALFLKYAVEAERAVHFIRG